MRIAIVAGERESLVPSTLVVALAKMGHSPVVVLRLRPRGRGRVRAWLRRSRILRMLRDAVRGRTRDTASTVGRRAFEEFGRTRGLAGWDQSLAAVCRRLDVPLVPIQSVNDSATVSAVKSREIDLLLNLVPMIYRDLLDAPRIGVLNAHMGPLPRIQGMNAAEWSVFLGYPTRVTIHFLAKKIDGGKILLECDLDTEGAEGFEVVRGRSGPVFVAGFCDAVAGLAAGTLEPRTQSGEGAQYYVMHPRVRAIAEGRLNCPAGAPRPPPSPADPGQSVPRG